MNKLEAVRDDLLARLADCDLCPRKCRVNRQEGKLGFCRTGRLARVNSAFLHFGEEPEIIGNKGSGTVFFSNCNLDCNYCQNEAISHIGEGKEISAQGLAQIMLDLATQGAENINLVTPTHVIAQIIEALAIAREKGLKLPIVYNSGGYDSPDILKIVEGMFDIYMPDIKYSDNAIAQRFSNAPDYWDVVRLAVREMFRQAGNLVVEGGAAKKGLLIRHLVLPNHLSGSMAVMDFIREEISRDAYVNIMDQYRPCAKAGQFPELNRMINREEYREVVLYASRIGLQRGFEKI